VRLPAVSPFSSRMTFRIPCIYKHLRGIPQAYTPSSVHFDVLTYGLPVTCLRMTRLTRVRLAIPPKPLPPPIRPSVAETAPTRPSPAIPRPLSGRTVANSLCAYPGIPSVSCGNVRGAVRRSAVHWSGIGVAGHQGTGRTPCARIGHPHGGSECNGDNDSQLRDCPSTGSEPT
jgi:hypothetical protein